MLTDVKTGMVLGMGSPSVGIVEHLCARKGSHEEVQDQVRGAHGEAVRLGPLAQRELVKEGTFEWTVERHGQTVARGTAPTLDGAIKACTPEVLKAARHNRAVGFVFCFGCNYTPPLATTGHPDAREDGWYVSEEPCPVCSRTAT